MYAGEIIIHLEEDLVTKWPFSEGITTGVLLIYLFLFGGGGGMSKNLDGDQFLQVQRSDSYFREERSIHLFSRHRPAAASRSCDGTRLHPGQVTSPSIVYDASICRQSCSNWIFWP